MENPSTQSIDASILTPILRKSLRRDHVQILDWQITRLGGGAGNPVSIGLSRIAGTAQDQDELVNWSVILKVIQSPANTGWVNMGEGEDQTHWNYWKREPLVYQSGYLDTLPEGICAPRCFGITELPGDYCWLWLEDITDSYADNWTLARFALSARHLGRLNGSFLAERSSPVFSWYSKNRTRQWLDSLPWKATQWDHPKVLARYPSLEQNTFRRMLVEHDRFLTRLDLLPQTISHGDTYPTNFKSRRLKGGQEQTVALDWALMGIGPLGDDLGQFVFGAQTSLKEIHPTEVENALFQGYLEGLRDSGYQVDPLVVRFGYTATAAFRVGLFQLLLLSQEIQHGENAAQVTSPQFETTAPFEVVMAEEANKLLEIINH